MELQEEDLAQLVSDIANGEKDVNNHQESELDQLMDFLHERADELIGCIELSAEALMRGVSDAMTAADMAVTEEAVQAAISALQQKQMASKAAESEALSSAARAEGEAFLAENGQRDGVMTTESGLQYEIIEANDSEERPTAENTVRVHYHGTLINGTVFDSSVERGEPVEFPLNQVITGWTEGVQLMAKGEKYRLLIPAALAYGDSQASPQIPPGSTLIFEVELLEII